MRKNNQVNLGWLFYKDYYRDDDFYSLIETNKIEKKLKSKNKKLVKSKFNKPELEEVRFKINSDSQKKLEHLEFKTTYPGLLIGSGLLHGIGEDEEFKIGFHFDYTTGLPVIPGSSVKGLLRSAFPDENDRYDAEKKEYIKMLLMEITDEQIDIEALREEIFEGKDTEGNRLSSNKCDTFFDAQIIKGDKKGRILGEDYITPHDHPLKDPTPLKFLKVLPEVVFQFKFDLKGEIISKEEKLKLFKKIILDLGVGAKTNVGYGALEEM